MPNLSVQPKEASQIAKESAQIKEGSPRAYSPPPNSKLVAKPSTSPHITISSDSMLVDNTKVTANKIEDPLKDFGASIVGNIVDYSSSNDEEDQKTSKEATQKMETSIEVCTSSVPLLVVVVVGTSLLLLKQYQQQLKINLMKKMRQRTLYIL